MMFKKLIVGMSLGLFCLVASATDVIFCKDVNTKSFDPVEPGIEFAGTSVSWVVKWSKAIGKPQMVVSVYKDGESQKLLNRETIETNPKWNVFAVQNMAFPEPGQYTIGITTVAGDELASGSVTLTEATVEEPPKEEKKMGSSLEDLFNRFDVK